MFSALKRLAGRGDVPETGTSYPSHQTMSANLQRKFARGVQYNMKIVIKGDRNVGKTCLFYRLQGKTFVESYIPTDEIQVASIHWNYKATDDIVKVEVWDVVDKGKKKKTFDGLKLDNSQLEIPEEAALDAEFLDVYKNANGVILVMDITKSWTFNYIQKELPKIPEHIPIMILANHCDMAHHRTVTPHHLSFFVENLQRSPNAAQVRCCESSMRNGFGLKILHKFFNLPFLQLQRDTLLKQLETNKNETALTINELDLYMESDDADYNKFSEKLMQKRRVMADAAKPLHLQNSQSVHQFQHSVSNLVTTSPSEPDIKRSTSFNETLKIGPIGGGHPISLGLHKTAIGVGNPHSKVIGYNFNFTDNNTRLPGKFEQAPQMTDKNSVPEIVASKEGGRFISKLFGKSKEATAGTSERKSIVNQDNTTSVDDFVPDDGTIDRSFLEDAGQEAVTNNIVSDSDSEDEFGNPLVSGFQDDLDPDDLNVTNNYNNDNKTVASHNNDNNNHNVKNNSSNSNSNFNNINNSRSTNYSFSKSSCKDVNEISAEFNFMTLSSTINNLKANKENLKELGVLDESPVKNLDDNLQSYDITGEALDTWFRCDSKWRRSPEGGEDNQSDCQKMKDDINSIDSNSYNNSLLDISSGKKEKKKSKDKETDGKSKKSKKKTTGKSKEKSKEKNGEKKKKKSLKSDDENQERDELEEFLNGPSAGGLDASYEAF